MLNWAYSRNMWLEVCLFSPSLSLSCWLTQCAFGTLLASHIKKASHLLHGVSQQSAPQTFDMHAAPRCWLTLKSIPLLLMTFLFHRGRSQLKSGGGEAKSNEWDVLEANPTDTVPVRLVGSQREMKCINGESVLLQVQVRFQSKAKQNRSSSARFHSESRQRAGRAGGYSRCSYILRLFPQKHPLHETDILFTKEKDRRAFRFPPPLARPDRLTRLLFLLLLLPPSLLLRLEGHRLFESLWLPEWFSIKPRLLKGPSDFLKK